MNARSSTMMHSDLAAPSYNSMMSVRPQHGPYTSLPGTPVGLDPRSMAQSDLSLAMNHARLSLETPDYFTGAPRYGGGLRPRSPYPGDYEPESGYVTSSHGSSDLNLSSLICKTNLAAQLVNGQISHTAKYGKVFPHMCDDGRYPSDFAIPKTVETMKVLDNSQLDRIMQAYRLPLDIRSYSAGVRAFSQATMSSSRVRQIKLEQLWEFLGAYKLMEFEKVKRGLY